MKKIIIPLLTSSIAFVSIPVSLTSCNVIAKPSNAEKVELVFASGGGGTLSGDVTIYVEKGKMWKNINKPECIPSTGNVFRGWFNNGIKVEDDYVINGNLNVVALFEPKLQQVKINFVVSGSGSLSGETEIYINKGLRWDKVTKPQPVPGSLTKFDGWYINNTKIDDWDAINSDTTVIAKFVDIQPVEYCYLSFSPSIGGILQGATTVPVTKNTKWKSVIKPRYQPEKLYSWKGWFTNGAEMEDDNLITSSLSIVGQFELDPSFLITFSSCGDGTLQGELAVRVAQNTQWKDVIKPEPFPSDTSKWDGWYSNNVLMEDTTVITKDMAVVGNFVSREKANISFTADEHGSIKEPQIVSVFTGTKWKNIAKPVPVPESQEYKFIGWFNNGVKMQDDDKVNNDLSITARFAKQEYITLSCKTNESDVSFKGEQVFTNIVKDTTKWLDIKQNMPTAIKPNYVFSHWVDKDGMSIDDNQTFSDDTTIYPKFNVNYVTLTFASDDPTITFDGSTQIIVSLNLTKWKDINKPVPVCKHKRLDYWVVKGETTPIDNDRIFTDNTTIEPVMKDDPWS